MANNPYVNKVQLADGTSLMDITGTTAVATDVLAGKYFFSASGELTLGTNQGGSGDGYVWQDAQGYVHLSDEEGTQPIYDTLNVSGSGTFTPSQGHAYNSVVVPSGTATAPNTISGTSASVSTGTNTLTLTKTVSVTPSVTTAGYVSSGTAGNASVSLTASVNTRSSSDLSASGDTVTVPSGYYASNASKAVSSGTEGTPTATKGTVSSHSIAVTPSVTNTAGYISGGTKTGTAVSVSASELVSGNLPITQNGNNIDCANYSTVSVNVSGGGGTNAPTFTITFNDSWTTIISTTCDKTFAEVRSLISDGVEYAIVVMTDQSGTEEYELAAALGSSGGSSVIYYSGAPFPEYEITLSSNNTATTVAANNLIPLSVTSNGTYTPTYGQAYNSVTVNVSGGISGVAKGTLNVPTKVNTATNTVITTTTVIGFVPTKFIFYRNEYTSTANAINYATCMKIGNYVVRSCAKPGQDALAVTTVYTDWGTTNTAGQLYYSSVNIYIRSSSTNVLEAGDYTWVAVE